MSQFDAIIDSIKGVEYSERKQLLDYLLRVVEGANRKKALTQEDRSAILEYAYFEIDELLKAITSEASYKKKDLLFQCEDCVLGLIMNACPNPAELGEEKLARIELLVETVAKERYIETCIDELFAQEIIEENEANHLIFLVKGVSDEYQRGKLYEGLIHYNDGVSKLTAPAKALISAHIEAEISRYLGKSELCDDCIRALELIADASKHYMTDNLAKLLREAMRLGYSNINYYAVETLLICNKEIDNEAIVALAKDLEYAYLTHSMLCAHDREGLFPKEFTSEEYLAKSDMVHWLVYPTELGKQPDEIEYVGKVTYLFKKEVYHVFKFRSSSDNLDDSLKNKWLIGWSSDEGGTFSNFDEYALFEKPTIDATLKNIKKKLIG